MSGARGCLLNRERLHWPACGRSQEALTVLYPGVVSFMTGGVQNPAVAEDLHLSSLRDDIAAMLAAALESEQRHAADTDRRDQQHIAETERRDKLHLQEMQRRDDLHAHETDMIRSALETRDLIGQAKGVIMAALACTPDEAFLLIRQQSQHENRKLVEVAAEVARRASSRTDGPYRPARAP